MVIKARRLEGWGKVKGLIGKEKSEAVYFETRGGIHTFGLKFPIDVLVLDNEGTVVQLKKSLQPNKFFFWNAKYKKVVELPVRSIRKLNIKVGNKIDAFLLFL